MKISLIKNRSAWIVFIYDILSALFSWEMVHVFFQGKMSEFNIRQFTFVLLAFILSSKVFRTYAALWRALSTEDLKRLIYSVALGSIIFFTFEFSMNRMVCITRSEVVMYPISTLIIILSGRFFYRHFFFLGLKKKKVKKIIILGGGNGANLFIRENELLNSPYSILGIFDDNRSLHGKLLRNNIIVGSIAKLANKNFLLRYPANEILIAIPSLNKRRLQELYNSVLGLGIPVKILPSITELIHGAKLTDLQEVKIEDLLARDQVVIDSIKLHDTYSNRTVLVTGGAGSIGSEICRQLIKKSSLKNLIILDHSEFNLYLFEEELKSSAVLNKINLKFILASVTDMQTLSKVFNVNKIDIIFHAAAYKHVPLLENQPYIAIQNNILGTKHIVDLSIKNKVQRFLFVSTDKAVNPTNVMGATKRIAELYVNSQANKRGVTTKFMVTRFGNVLGSAGSVVPLFKKQLKTGGPLTVTHKDIERYFMTIPEASLLVILSCAIASGNETFVLEMGEPVKILKLAEQMIKLSGKIPYENIDIKFTGLRPGEKMYEELFYRKEKLKSSGFNKLLVGQSIYVNDKEINNIIDKLLQTKTTAKEDLFKFVRSLSNIA